MADERKTDVKPLRVSIQDIRELTAVAGICTITYGLWEIYHPVAWIFLGLTLCGMAILGTIAGPR